ncbi:hypothetical protein BV378_22655 [Nostoc sp. RF31YmG]|nr:hypothetical protein BV378_22655 [Nostoc sp. RF31YmG]
MLDSQQPTEFDVVLGGQFPSPMSAAVLGGMEGIIQRLASPLSANQHAVLPQLIPIHENPDTHKFFVGV